MIKTVETFSWNERLDQAFCCQAGTTIHLIIVTHWFPMKGHYRQTQVSIFNTVGNVERQDLSQLSWFYASDLIFSAQIPFDLSGKAPQWDTTSQLLELCCIRYDDVREIKKRKKYISGMKTDTLSSPLTDNWRAFTFFPSKISCLLLLLLLPVKIVTYYVFKACLECVRTWNQINVNFMQVHRLLLSFFVCFESSI